MNFFKKISSAILSAVLLLSSQQSAFAKIEVWRCDNGENSKQIIRFQRNDLGSVIQYLEKKEREIDENIINRTCLVNHISLVPIIAVGSLYVNRLKNLKSIHTKKTGAKLGELALLGGSTAAALLLSSKISDSKNTFYESQKSIRDIYSRTKLMLQSEQKFIDAIKDSGPDECIASIPLEKRNITKSQMNNLRGFYILTFNKDEQKLSRDYTVKNSIDYDDWTRSFISALPQCKTSYYHTIPSQADKDADTPILENSGLINMLNSENRHFKNFN